MVERRLAKAEVAGSSPVSRSTLEQAVRGLLFFCKKITGAEVMIGVYLDEGFYAKASVGTGWLSCGFVFRAKCAQ